MLLRRLFVKYFPGIFIRLLFFKTYRHSLDLTNPRYLYEKLIWLNFYAENPLKRICADKFAAREYIEKSGYGYTLNDLFGVYTFPNEIDFESLPGSFVLKCTHGSGMNIICTEKSSFNKKKAVNQLKRWQRVDYYEMYGEKQYKGIKRRIICEKFLGDDILDYKVYCFHGIPEFIMLGQGRSSGSIKWYLYDFEWNYLEFLKDHLDDPHFEKPGNLDEIYDYCKALSTPFIFVRVDFYNIDDRIIFGELTFSPSAFMDNTTTSEINLEMGSLINLDNIKNNPGFKPGCN